MSSPITLVVRNIGELVTGDPRQGQGIGLLSGGLVAAAGEWISLVGSESDLRHLPMADEIVEIDAGGAAVIPGFVDAHTHLVWCGDRSEEYGRRSRGESYEQIAAAGGGIASTVRATAASSVAELVAAARPRVQRMLKQGTTTVEIKSGYGVDGDAEMRLLDAALQLGVESTTPDVVTTFLPFHAAPPGDRAEFVERVCREDLLRAHSKARFVDAFCETGAFSVEECEQLFAAARGLGFGVKLHAEQRSHSGGALLAARVGAASADHLEFSDCEDHRAMAQAGVTGVLLPGAALVLGGPPPPGRALVDAGVTVAVATDCNPGTCYAESMPLMISLAVATCGLTATEALSAATAGGAAALGLRDRGILRKGMRCDLSILRSKRWMDVAYHLGGDEVGTVVRAGRVVSGSEMRAQ